MSKKNLAVRKKISIEKPSEKKMNQTGQLFYRYDCENEIYRFISPSINQLIGYSIEEINSIKLSNLIRNQLTERKTVYSTNENDNEFTVEEITATNLVETKDGELKWIEDNSITFNGTADKSTVKFGTLKDVTGSMRDEKIRQIISEILEASNSEKNLKELFKFIHTCIKKLMKADNFYIAYYKKDSDILTFPYFVDEYDTDAREKKMGKGLTEYILRTGKSALVDTELDEELKQKGEIELIGPQSPIWLGVPLKIEEKTIGVMVVQDYNDPDCYGKREKRILDVISYPISRAIERKMVEEEREEMIKKLKELNLTKDQLFSLISHDLRSPFNSLLGFAEILTDEFETLTQRDIKEYIKVINDSAKTLFGMTNNLLHYSRLQLNKFDFEPKQINLYDTIRHLADSLKIGIMKKDLLVKIDIDDECVVYADEEILNILLENLIQNSIKYSNIGNIIKVVAEKNFDSKENINLIQLRIIDEGVGISEDNLLKIRSGIMYSTLGTAKESGLGLGLLLTEKFVEIHNGKMDIISAEGEGTTIILTLPAESKNQL